jgi:hypothetical protein
MRSDVVKIGDRSVPKSRFYGRQGNIFITSFHVVFSIPIMSDLWEV